MTPKTRPLCRSAAKPKTYRPKLEVLEERLALSTFTVINTNDSGAGSLRQAILSANAATGTDLIDFNIPGSGVQSIRPTTALPNITGPVTIDGYTQPGTSANTLAVGNTAALLIELDGSQAPLNIAGLTINSGGSAVRGLVINGFHYGIRLENSDGNTIAGNFIGTDPTGTIARGNKDLGIYVLNSDRNTIGGPDSADRNLISGNLSGIRLGFHISMDSSRDNVIQGNYIGTNAAGTAPLANFRGIYSVTPDINIARNNLISGNTNQGLIIERSNNWVIQGNRIGTDATGTQAVPNGQGIHINGSAGTVIGGTTPEDRNLISGNSRDGLFFGYGFSANSSAPNLVQGNFIGTDVSGTLDLGNGWSGVLVGDWQSGGAGFGVFQVGGTVEGARNVISGNGVDGIRAGSSGVVTIQGNYIGTDVTGTQRLGNSYRGVGLDGLTGGTLKLGGVSAQERNIISANGAYGVHVTETNAVVQGNYIGTDVTGTANLGNSSAGVYHSSYDGGIRRPTIGGLAPEAGNLIAYNRSPGIWSIAQLDPAAFLGNRIHSNAGLGIDLGNGGFSYAPYPDGVTPNDAGDGDGGPNSHQNYPVLTTVESSLAGTRVVGSLNSIAGQTYRLEFFANAFADPSGFGEGQTFLGAVNVTTDASTTKAFDAMVPGIAPLGHLVSATATRLDTGGNPFETSEFSGNLIVVSGNSAPTAAPDLYSVNEDGILTVAVPGVLANDTDPDGNALTAVLVSGTANGLLTLNANGSFTYTPAANFNGTDRFTYRASDGSFQSDEVTVTLTVNALNDAPELLSVQVSLPAINEDEFGNAGLSLPEFLSRLTILDVDAGALQGLAVTGTNHSFGAWQFSTDGGATWTPFGATSTAAARLLADDSSNRIRFVPGPNFDGTATMFYRAWDQTSGTNGGTADVSQSGGVSAFSLLSRPAVLDILPLNDAPVANAGPDQEKQEGETVQFDGTGSSDVEGSVLTYTWDFGDGTTSASPTPTHAYGDNGSYTVTLTISDSLLSSTDTMTVLVSNVAPTAAVTGTTSGVRGQMRSFSGSFTDPGFADTHTLAWQVLDTTSLMLASGSGANFDFVPTEMGSYTVRFIVTDDDGGIGVANQTLVVSVIQLQADPCHSGASAMVVGGTTSDDRMFFAPGENAGEISVTVNGVSQGIFQPTGRIIAYAQAGNDDIQLAGSILLSAWLYGGSGDDRLKGASGDDLLLGEDGSDLLVGGSGRDLLIGGVGADRIVGNADDDILIAGTTLFDAQVAALCAILGEWTSSRSYEQRIANLSGTGSGDEFANRLNGTFFLKQEGADPTVLHDDACDVMTGSAGIDWFFADLDGDVTDKITDLNAAEFAADLDWITNG